MKHTIGAGWLRSSTHLNAPVYDGTRKSGQAFTGKLTLIGVYCGFDRKHGGGLETGPDVSQFEDKTGNKAGENRHGSAAGITIAIGIEEDGSR
jgi:hypothetical protein